MISNYFDFLKYGLKLYNFVVNNYSWENKINDWEELYKATLK